MSQVDHWQTLRAQEKPWQDPLNPRQALAESEKCLLHQIQSIGFAFGQTKSKLIKGAVQRIDNRGCVCPSGRVAVKGFFVRNHF
jgi:hypothetical protein